MTSMARPTTRVVVGGVDTHGQTHHAAVIDEVGRQPGDREFTASPAGYRAWLIGSADTAPSPRSAGRAPARTVRPWPAIYAQSGSPWWRSTAPIVSRAARTAGPTLPTPMPPPKLSCRGRRRGRRSCEMVASRRSGRFAWPVPARSKPVVGPPIRSRR